MAVPHAWPYIGCGPQVPQVRTAMIGFPYFLHFLYFYLFFNGQFFDWKYMQYEVNEQYTIFIKTIYIKLHYYKSAYELMKL